MNSFSLSVSVSLSVRLYVCLTLCLRASLKMPVTLRLSQAGPMGFSVVAACRVCARKRREGVEGREELVMSGVSLGVSLSPLEMTMCD